ncbi:hypothetical protein THRCLA_22058 [Thraustotheca clavata]|uniref:Uncharacterized protein n=1 Tax=Thraustotheca clavata TaxID=74557 RepID=A0A1V9ZCZ8_9STRA|nr:hypothetical protein THRCLA_22058 [Thraustotheca clavata]
MATAKEPTRQTIKRRKERDEKLESNRCRYKTGTCMNERAKKPNDMYHSLCEKHRVLHNFNQRNFDRKKRAIRKLLEGEPTSPVSSSMTTDEEDDLELKSNTISIEPIYYHGPAVLRWSDEDLYILNQLLP